MLSWGSSRSSLSTRPCHAHFKWHLVAKMFDERNHNLPQSESQQQLFHQIGAVHPKKSLPSSCGQWSDTLNMSLLAAEDGKQLRFGAVWLHGPAERSTFFPGQRLEQEAGRRGDIWDDRRLTFWSPKPSVDVTGLQPSRSWVWFLPSWWPLAPMSLPWSGSAVNPPAMVDVSSRWRMLVKKDAKAKHTTSAM